MSTAFANPIQGGGFLIQTSTPENTFTPEDFNEEHLMIADMCKDFLNKEVIPNLIAIDQQQAGLMPS